MKNMKLVNALEDQLKDVRKKLSNTNESVLKIVDSYEDDITIYNEFAYESDKNYQRLSTMVGYYEGQIKGLEMAIELVNPLSNPFSKKNVKNLFNVDNDGISMNDFNTEIYRLNEINYQEMMINHMQYAIENKTSYKELMIKHRDDYDSKVLLMSEIDKNGLRPLMNELMNDYLNGGK